MFDLLVHHSVRFTRATQCSIYSCNTVFDLLVHHVFDLLVQHSVRVTRATRSSPLRATAFSIYTHPGTAIRYPIVALGCLLPCEHHTLLTHTFHIFNTHTHTYMHPHAHRHKQALQTHSTYRHTRSHSTPLLLPL